jgi:3',5'-cyclic AMP phosphodiesterase CpdA
MSLILHLSDLHLAPAGSDTDEGDYAKLDLLSPQERQKKVALVRSTLRDVYRSLDESGDELGGIVISGDITVRNHEEGFKLLDGLLKELGPKRPPNQNVVVVPGNHDVAWQRSPFDPQTDQDRYANFVEYVRKAGYVTPLLDGIDFESETLTRTLDPTEHLLLDSQKRWVIIPINSSHFCGRAQRLNAKEELAWRSMATKLRTTVQDLGEKLGTTPAYDVARIQPEQLEHIGTLMMDELRKLPKRTERGTGTLRIAVLHHHLQPPKREEFKPFESITNLAHFREFLRTHEIDVVLHGHKHSGCLYWDHIYRCNNDVDRFPHPVFVVAAPAPGGAGDQPIARLLRVDEEREARTLSVASIRSTTFGTRGDHLSWINVPLWSSDFGTAPNGIHTVHGGDFDTTYARLRALFRDQGSSDHLYNVICRTESPLAETRSPAGYPEVPEAESLEAWFKEMVDWWQQESSRLEDEGYFTHGSRIKRFGNERVNQLNFVTKVLQKKLEFKPGDHHTVDSVRRSPATRHLPFVLPVAPFHP